MLADDLIRLFLEEVAPAADLLIVSRTPQLESLHMRAGSIEKPNKMMPCEVPALSRTSLYGAEDESWPRRVQTDIPETNWSCINQELTQI